LASSAEAMSLVYEFAGAIALMLTPAEPFWLAASVSLYRE
jgi:hypothetical protein